MYVPSPEVILYSPRKEQLGFLAPWILQQQKSNCLVNWISRFLVCIYIYTFFSIYIYIFPGSPRPKRMVFGMVHMKDSLLPMGKVWSLDFLGIYICLKWLNMYVQFVIKEILFVFDAVTFNGSKLPLAAGKEGRRRRIHIEDVRFAVQ